LSPTPHYRGRFAPSPTGPLHQGSLVAALASYLQARAQGGQWLVRMEDIDIPRNVPGAADVILRCLEACGLEWDGPVLYQTTRFEAYAAALAELRIRGAAYDCGCSRKEAGAGVYPGTCRNGLAPGRTPRSVRLRVPGGEVRFTDAIRGVQSEDVAAVTGDFPLLRADWIWAYQLAVVVDDAWQGITHIVRGEDLLDSTPRQTLLQQLLGYPTPSYAHIRVVLGADGQKLSKQTLAPAVDLRQPAAALSEAFRFLGYAPPAELAACPPRELLQWGVASWKEFLRPV